LAVMLSIAKFCVTEGKLLFHNSDYCQIISLQSFATSMVTLKHNIQYQHFYALITYLLTLPVTSASREKALHAVNIVKSAAIEHR
jgi:hypothetical protein